MYFFVFAVSGVYSFRILYAVESRRKTYIYNTVYSVEMNSTRGELCSVVLIGTPLLYTRFLYLSIGFLKKNQIFFDL